MYWGTRTTAFGIIRLPTRIAKIASRPGQRIRGQRAREEHQDDGAHRDDGAVEEGATDARRARAAEEHLAVVRECRGPWNPLRWEPHDVGRRLERGDDDPDGGQ